MSKEILIVGVKTGKEGVVLKLSGKTKLKTGNLLTDEFWLSWDKIGGVLFNDYTTLTNVKELEAIRDKYKDSNEG